MLYLMFSIKDAAIMINILTLSDSTILMVILETASPMPLASRDKPPLLKAEVFFALGN